MVPLPARLPEKPRNKHTEKPVRVAIVGLQHNHIHSVVQYARRTGRMQIVAVVEPEAEIRDPFVQELHASGMHVAAYAGLDELLIKHAGDRGVPGHPDRPGKSGHTPPPVDAAARAPANADKAPLAIRCMEAGLHVLIDKPMVVDWDQLKALRQAHERTGRVVSLMLTLRFDPCYATARRLVREGAVGRLVHAWLTRPHKLKRSTRPAWMFRRETYGGLIPDLCVHDIDIFRWVTGAAQEDIAQLSALHGRYGASGDGELEDAAHVLLRLQDGTVGSFEASWLTPAAAPYHGDCRAIFTGTQGTVEVDTVRSKVVLTTDRHSPVEVPLDETDSVEDDFIRGIRLGTEHMTLPPEEAFESTAWTLLARDAADAGESEFT